MYYIDFAEQFSEGNFFLNQTFEGAVHPLYYLNMVHKNWSQTIYVVIVEYK